MQGREQMRTKQTKYFSRLFYHMYDGIMNNLGHLIGSSCSPIANSALHKIGGLVP